MARLVIPKPDLVLTNQGVEIRLSRDYTDLEQQSMTRLQTILSPYPRAAEALTALVQEPEVRAAWDMADYLAVMKLGYTDHGEVHHKVVATAGASMLQLLAEGGIQPDVVTSGAGDLEDAFVTVTAAALLHDIGNLVHRVNHPDMSVVLALPVLDRLLTPIYPEAEKRFEIRAFILHAIRAHDIDPPPLTMEAALVAVADACDMTKGRARYSFDLGTISIHSVGGLAIERVVLGRGQQKPVRIQVELSNSAGIFPVEEYLLPKVNAGALAPYAEVVVTAEPEASAYDQRIIYTVEMQGKRFVALDQPPRAPALTDRRNGADPATLVTASRN